MSPLRITEATQMTVLVFTGSAFAMIIQNTGIKREKKRKDDLT